MDVHHYEQSKHIRGSYNIRMLIIYLNYVNIKTIVNDYAKNVVLLMVMEHAVNKNNNNTYIHT
jgi:hypothetical protein